MTIKAQKVAINKQYEVFFSLKDETLSETFQRFTSLLAKMEMMGITKEQEDLLEKFCDILPSKHEAIIGTLRNSGHLYTHTLETLHAAFKHDEENRAKRLIDERNAYANVVGYHQNVPVSQYSASTALVAAVTEAPELHTQLSLLSSNSTTTFLSLNKMMSDSCSSGWLNNITDEEEENETDDLVCMVAKTFNCFKSRSKRFRQKFKGPSTV